ncbi:hypothetical protein, partial [Modestobacter versicolor]|uniref:hypothetical protein n=1 Tax=Modestobacter versicolor TaxID=429133 RepID=UPI003F689EE2
MPRAGRAAGGADGGVLAAGGADGGALAAGVLGAAGPAAGGGGVRGWDAGGCGHGGWAIGEDGRGFPGRRAGGSAGAPVCGAGMAGCHPVGSTGDDPVAGCPAGSR